jgi:hypothetical protein
VTKWARGRRVWVVRFRASDEEGRRLRSIYVGDQPDLVRRAGALLAELQAPRRLAREAAAAARCVRAMARLVRRLTGRP